MTVPRPIRWGDLRRSRPVSEGYGFDRGTPVDRVYIRRFLDAHVDVIRGEVAEIGDDGYALSLGTGVTATCIVDVDETNVRADIVADLAEPGSLPVGRFDCFILTQTLQYVDDLGAALANLWASLAPWGTLLVTVPCLSRIDAELRWVDRWRLTPVGLATALEAVCHTGRFSVAGFGSLTTSVAFLMGLSAEELDPAEVERYDPDFPLLAAAWATREG